VPLLTCEFDGGGVAGPRPAARGTESLAVREWHATSDGVESRRNHDYKPALFVDGPRDALDTLRQALQRDPKVASTRYEAWHTELGARERSTVLRVGLDRVMEVRTLAREIRGLHEQDSFHPGTFRLYNVDLAPQFRYCIETGTAPVPERELDIVDLDISETALRDEDVTALTVDGNTLGGTPTAVLDELHDRLATRDPDVLCCSTAHIVPFCHEQAADIGLEDFRLGRAAGYEQLAGASTYESYGQVGHSPARFRVPGRAVVDRSNSFLLDESGIPGLLDLVERSWRPLQETAWGSIGTILTAIQVREALERDVLVPWNKWQPEQFKSVETLHAADRGGFTFAPEVGSHEAVVEVDFGSLYPNIMVEYNISPETVCCDCHDTDDVPGLGYTICERDGFIPDVLEPIITDRAAIKKEIAATNDDQRRTELQARSDALKWILVSCFGYQGYRNAKFGRIECHEAINAVARELLLDAKERLEAGGWRVVHGIVDSLWVQPVDGEEQEPLAALAATISEAVNIPLEIEDRFDWVCFVPRRESEAGALTKYFGRVSGRDEYKLRGIEARQRSTPPFVEALQRDLIRTLDESRDPEPVCDRLHRGLRRLERGDVPADELCITKRVSQRPDAYEQRTQTVAALERAATQGLDRHPGQDIEYVVVDDNRRSKERVQLGHEPLGPYDEDFYRELAVRAGESVLSPFGWDRSDIERTLAGHDVLTLSSF
jgi:DNA polymerase I